MNNKLALKDEILLTIDKPARYIGNEVNMVRKNPEAVKIVLPSHSRMYMKSVCHILASRSCIINSIYGMMCTVNVSIPPGQICTRL